MFFVFELWLFVFRRCKGMDTKNPQQEKILLGNGLRNELRNCGMDCGMDCGMQSKNPWIMSACKYQVLNVECLCSVAINNDA